MLKIVLKIRYFERGLSKSLGKVNLFLLLNPVIFNGQSYQKRKRPGASDQLLFRLQNKFRKIPLLVTYYLTRDYSKYLCLQPFLLRRLSFMGTVYIG